jgi:hypothetical protein
MELLLPMAAKKLDLSYNIDRDVPPCMHIHLSATMMTLTFSFRGASGLYTHPPRYALYRGRHRFSVSLFLQF